MKRLVTPIAAAVGIALASGAAHAQLSSPGFTTTTPTSQTTLILAVWDPLNDDSEVMNLSYLDEQISVGSFNSDPSAFVPNSPTAPFVVATNPATGSGSVLQLNFGTVPEFSSTFSGIASSSIDYGVYAADDVSENNVLFTSSVTPTLTYTGENTVNGKIYGEVGAIESSGTGENADTTGNPTWSVQTGPLASGSFGTTQSFDGAVGTSLGFYYENNTNPGRGNPPLITTYANSSGAGFWYLSTSGDLTWNVPYEVSAVPLPAAAWLLASGLLGLGAVARRRRAGGALAV